MSYIIHVLQAPMIKGIFHPTAPSERGRAAALAEVKAHARKTRERRSGRSASPHAAVRTIAKLVAKLPRNFFRYAPRIPIGFYAIGGHDVLDMKFA
jgi:hypothetical protein